MNRRKKKMRTKRKCYSGGTCNTGTNNTDTNNTGTNNTGTNNTEHQYCARYQ